MNLKSWTADSLPYFVKELGCGENKKIYAQKPFVGGAKGGDVRELTYEKGRFGVGKSVFNPRGNWLTGVNYYPVQTAEKDNLVYTAETGKLRLRLDNGKYADGPSLFAKAPNRVKYKQDIIPFYPSVQAYGPAGRATLAAVQNTTALGILSESFGSYKSSKIHFLTYENGTLDVRETVELNGFLYDTNCTALGILAPQVVSGGQTVLNLPLNSGPRALWRNNVENDNNTIHLLDKGFIRLVDFMGSDNRVVSSARVSFGGTSKGEERDKGLIKYLLEHKHHTPFEHCYFQFHVCCPIPIYVARQWMRHRWGSFNEISARYTQVKDEFYIPSHFRGQDFKNRQGSVEAHMDDEALRKLYEDSVEASFAAYNKLIEAGVAREMARGVLPVCQAVLLERQCQKPVKLPAAAHGRPRPV